MFATWPGVKDPAENPMKREEKMSLSDIPLAINLTK